MPLIHVQNPETATEFKRRYMKIYNLGEELPPAEKLLTQEWVRGGKNSLLRVV